MGDVKPVVIADTLATDIFERLTEREDRRVIASSRSVHGSSYRIVTVGTLPEAWHDRVAGMRIESNVLEGSDRQTVLTGMLRDQAELSGVLDVLLSLNLEIVSIAREDTEKATDGSKR